MGFGFGGGRSFYSRPGRIPKMELWPHQAFALSEIKRLKAERVNPVLLQSPTGGMDIDVSEVVQAVRVLEAVQATR